VNVRAGSQLWGESYTRRVADIQSMEQDIAKEISDKLRPKLTGEEKKRFSKRDTTNADAYQLYLKGRYAWEKRTTESLKQSIEYFNQAIEKDASYAVAYAGLSNSYAVLSAFDYMSPKESFPRAISAARRALELDDGLAQPHATLGWALAAYDWNFPAAEKEFRTAVELDPSYATAHHWYGLMLSALGRSEESIAELGLATKLDPFSLVMQTNTVRALIYARQSDRAVELARSIVEKQPTSDLAHLWLGYAYESRGMLADALAEFPKSKNTAGIGRMFARMGRRSEARTIATGLEQQASQAYVSPFDVARVFAALGDKDQAFQWLDRAYADHSTNLLYAKVNPNLDDLHSDSRFTELLRRMNLPT
jgi:tetratricopeptide (TPR) repeat protein